jgi:hypothetical protein
MFHISDNVLSSPGFLKIKLDYLLIMLENRDSSVGMAGQLGARDFIVFAGFRPALWHTQALSQGVRRPKREADHSLASSAEVKNGGAIPALSHTPSWSGN